MVLQAGDVIGVRMAEQESVDEEAALVISFETASKVLRNVRGVVILIVRLAADVNVDEDALIVVEAEQGHVSIGDGEERDRGSHESSRTGFVQSQPAPTNIGTNASACCGEVGSRGRFSNICQTKFFGRKVLTLVTFRVRVAHDSGVSLGRRRPIMLAIMRSWP
jgi:hypothetical protein